MANLFAVISILVAIFIALIPHIRKAYLQGPELTIELLRNGGGSLPMGLSNKNIPDDDGVIEMRNAIQIFRLTWNLVLIIRNNSEQTAYYPRMVFGKDQAAFFSIDVLNEQEPIGSNGKITLTAVYQEVEEVKGEQRNKMIDLPPAIKDIQILLEYKNASKRTFYTHYGNTDKSNIFLRKKPKEFK